MRLVLRCDASQEIGHGHLMRCRALADHWSGADREVVLASCELTSGLRDQLVSSGFSVRTLPGPIGSPSDRSATLDLSGDSILVLDGYKFDPSYMRSIQGRVPCLGVIDDDARHEHYPVDVLINYNHHARRLDYSTQTPPSARLCLGLEYALIRSEFREQVQNPADPGDSPRILVSFGGSDPRNLTMKAAKALSRIDRDLTVDVVVGQAYPSIDELSDHLGSRTVQIHRSVPSLAPLMARSDLALCAGGLTVWELACSGTPMISVIHAQNQEPIARTIEELEIGRYLGWCHEVEPRDLSRALGDLLNNPQQLERYRKNARMLVDGQGPKRVGETLREVASHSGYSVPGQ